MKKFRFQNHLFLAPIRLLSSAKYIWYTDALLPITLLPINKMLRMLNTNQIYII